MKSWTLSSIVLTIELKKIWSRWFLLTSAIKFEVNGNKRRVKMVVEKEVSDKKHKIYGIISLPIIDSEMGDSECV